jgi:hypothetical protein
MVVISNEWNFWLLHRAPRIFVRIFDEDKVVRTDTAGKLSLCPKEISELTPTEEQNSAQKQTRSRAVNRQSSP